MQCNTLDARGQYKIAEFEMVLIWNNFVIKHIRVEWRILFATLSREHTINRRVSSHSAFVPWLWCPFPGVGCGTQRPAEHPRCLWRTYTSGIPGICVFPPIIVWGVCVCVSFSPCRLAVIQIRWTCIQYMLNARVTWSPGEKQPRRRHQECHVCTHAYAPDDFYLQHMSWFFISPISRLDVRQIETSNRRCFTQWSCAPGRTPFAYGTRIVGIRSRSTVQDSDMTETTRAFQKKTDCKKNLTHIHRVARM